MKILILILLILFGLEAKSQVSNQILQELDNELYPSNSEEENDFLYGSYDYNNKIVEIRARKNQPNKNKVSEICKKMRNTSILSDTSILIDIAIKYSKLFQHEWEKDLSIGNDYGNTYNHVLVELIKNYFYLKIKEQFPSERDQYYFLKYRYHRLACESLNRYNSKLVISADTMNNKCPYIDLLYISPFINFFERNASGASLVMTELIQENIFNYETYFIEDLLNLNLISEYCEYKCDPGILQHSFLYLIIPHYYTERSSKSFNMFLFRNYNKIKNAICVPCLLGNTGEMEGLEIFKHEFLSDSNAYNVMQDFSMSYNGKKILIPFVLSQLDKTDLSNQRKIEYIKYLGLQNDERIPSKLHKIFSESDNIELKGSIVKSLWNLYIIMNKDHSEFNKLEKMKNSIKQDYNPKYLNEK